MNIELRTFKGLPDYLQEQYASEIAAETQSKFEAEQKIVPIEPEAVLQREIGLVAVHNNVLVGYVGATKLNDTHTQIGTLLVSEQNQGSGIGAMLVSDITERVTKDGLQPYAFCNPNSQSSFEKAGYVPALPGELPAEAQSHFNNQPMIYPRQTIIYSLRAARNSMALVGQ